MPDSENPRSYIRSVPLAIPSHRGLKITARNGKIYTCDVPTRKEVARENYDRRRHQMTKCGYRSVNYKPYQPVGEVYLDDKKLILSALGQEQVDQNDQIQEELASSSSGESESEDEESLKQSKDQQQMVVPQLTNYKPKVMNDIRTQISKGRKMIHAVRLGFGLYRLIHDEQHMKQVEAEKERKQKEEAARNQMKPAASNDSEESDDELDLELKSYMIPVPNSPTREAEMSFGEHLDPRQAQERPNSSRSSSSSQRWRRLSSTVTAFWSPPTAQPVVQVPSRVAPPVRELSVDRSSTESARADHVMENAPPSSPSPSPSLRGFLHPTQSAHSNTSRTSRRSRKLRNPRPYSPLYSNIIYNDVTDSKSIFRQLCAMNWILEAMSQDQQPPVMPPITSCWILKDLIEDPKLIRKRVEKDKLTEANWVTFKQNPARFTQRGTRRGTRRISIHPNFIQRLAAANNGASSSALGPNALRVPVEARSRKESNASLVAETVTSTRTEAKTEHTHEQKSNQEDSDSAGNPSHNEGGPSVTFVDPKIRAVSAPPGPLGDDHSAVTPGALPVAMADTSSNESPQVATQEKTAASPRLQKQQSFTVTTVYTPPSNPSKAIQKIRAKTRAAKAFKSSLSQNEVEKLAAKPEEEQTTSDSRVRAWVQATGAVNTKRFAAAAIAAFGAISLDNRVEKVPVEMKKKFKEVANEKALVLHDNLEVRDRNRLQVLQRKLKCLETFNDIYKALEQMRSSGAVPDTETNEEMRQRVTEECKWYKDLISNLPHEVRADRYCTIVLNKIAGYGSLEGRKISGSQFLKVLSTLRVWEICAPDINAAIEFVREKVVEMSELEFEDWLITKFPQPQRAVSAPPPRTSGL